MFTRMNNDDRTHLQLLSIFHFVLGGMLALFALFPLIHFVLGLVILFGGFSHQDEAPPALMGALFATVGGAMVLVGEALAALMIFTGWSLQRQRRWLFCAIVAGAECAYVPFGTLLGVFTLVVLLRPQVKRAFEGGSESVNAVTPPTSPAA